MSQIPREARAGLLRAWLAILRERHPEVTWVPVAETSRETEAELRDLGAEQIAA